MHDLLNQMRLPAGVCWHQFEAQDLERMDDCLATDATMRVIDQAGRGPACTLWVDGIPLFSVGIMDCRNGSGEVWAVIDRSRRHQHPLLLTRSVKRSIDIATKSMSLSSVIMFVECARTDAVRWALALGFAEIGRLTIYNRPEQNHFIFLRS